VFQNVSRDCFERVRKINVFFQEELFVDGFQSSDFVGRKSATLKADLVDPADGGGVAVYDSERGDVLDDFGDAANDAVAAEAAELMDSGEARDDDVIADFDVPTESAVVGENVVIADLTVVGDVGVGEEEVVVADTGGDGFFGSAVNGGVFPEDVAISYFKVGGFSGVFEILGLGADG